MRHRQTGKKLNRSTNARKALFISLLTAFFENGKLVTTQAKAKAIQGKIDGLINKAKQSDLTNRRFIYSFLKTSKSIQNLIEEIAPRYPNRKSGYTRLIRIGSRRGDQAMMVKLELIKKDGEKDGEGKAKKGNKKKTSSKKTKTKKKK